MAILEYKSFEPKQVLDGTQVILFFGDYELSIVRHSGSYGGNKGLYEIGVFNGNTMVNLPGITAEHDTVKGWLTESDVDDIIKKMYFLTGVSPEQL
tara:strand:+ start:1490 stop:1777 length:288 start_codon:yes stop_codon:yes gene_type:complete